MAPTKILIGQILVGFTIALTTQRTFSDRSGNRFKDGSAKASRLVTVMAFECRRCISPIPRIRSYSVGHSSD